MALKHLQSLVLRVAATAVDNVTGLEGKFQAMRRDSAFLSYPRLFSPSYSMAEPSMRLGRGGAVDRGTALAVARAGRPGCWAGVTCRNLARNPRGTIQSWWSRPLVITRALRPGFGQARIAHGLFGAAFARA
jgi:hypothetical protein